jgi:hypothetical protein
MGLGAKPSSWAKTAQTPVKKRKVKAMMNGHDGQGDVRVRGSALKYPTSNREYEYGSLCGIYYWFQKIRLPGAVCSLGRVLLPR